MTGERERAPCKPAWLKVRPPAARPYRATQALLRGLDLHTVCEEARCPNKGECFAAGTATFLILGDVCTRACGFCSVRHDDGAGAAAGVPAGPSAAPPAAAALPGEPAGLCADDEDEPQRVAQAARRLGLRHVVVTSVTRDDLPDGGADAYATVVGALRAAMPPATVELLVPDMCGDAEALATVLAARPDVIGHNLETVPRLYPRVRPQAPYRRSRQLLERAASWARAHEDGGARAQDGGGGYTSAQEGGSDASGPTRAPGGASARPASQSPARAVAGHPLVKTGIMVGLGEQPDEVEELLADCARAGVDVLTIGQYLRPAAGCLPVERYVPPAEFVAWARRGAALGLRVHAAPFVRSSYRAGELLAPAAQPRGSA